MRSGKSMIKLKKASEEAKKGNYLKSISLCKGIIAKESNNVPAYKLLATNLIQLNRYSEVEIALKKVMKLVDEEESYPLIHLLGCNYISQGLHDNALHILENLFNKTGDSKVLLDIGLAHYRLGEYKYARDIYLKLIELEPDNQDAKRNLFPILYHLKEYKAAWTCFHSRLELPEVKEKIHWFAPQWSGESLVGKNILIFPEQGIGDNLDYSSCFSEAIAEAKNTYIVCDDRLKELYKYNFPTAKIISAEEVNQAQAIHANLDLQILAGSLSYFYKLNVESFFNKPNLEISEKLNVSIDKRLSKTKLRVGLSWFHGRVNDGNEFSMYLEDLLPMLKIEGVEWVNLQFGEWQKEVEAISKKHGIKIIHLEECSAAGDFNQYGSLIANLDLVISSSNAALMFASRLGIKRWMFLPAQLEGEVSNFHIDSSSQRVHYDSLSITQERVFHREMKKGWGTVGEDMRDALISLPEFYTQSCKS